MESTDETKLFDLHELVGAAEQRIRPYIRETPVEPSAALCGGGGGVWLKLDSQQVTGSFKVRGALNKLLQMPDSQREQRVIACSAGNHGLGVAYASQVCGVRSSIYVPQTIDPQRKRDLERFDSELIVSGATYGETERAALAATKESNATFVSPYNDLQVIAGQGTIGLELLRQIPELDIVVVAVGGGGLAAGVGAYVKALKPQAMVVGVSPVNSAMMFDTISGTPVEYSADLPTLSDSTAGPVQEGSITVPLCKAVVDQWVLVEEEDIRAAMRYLFFEHRLVVEGAGALAVAAFMKEQDRFKDANTALIVCGGNIDPKRFLGVMKGEG